MIINVLGITITERGIYLFVYNILYYIGIYKMSKGDRTVPPLLGRSEKVTSIAYLYTYYMTYVMIEISRCKYIGNRISTSL